MDNLDPSSHQGMYRPRQPPPPPSPTMPVAVPVQNEDDIIAAQQAWRQQKRREREQRNKKKAARQANADPAGYRDAGLGPPVAKRAKTYAPVPVSGPSAGVPYAEAHRVASAAAAIATVQQPAGAGAYSATHIAPRTGHFSYPTDSVPGSLLGMLGGGSDAPVDPEAAQKRWRQEKLRELAQKKQKTAPTKRGRRRSDPLVSVGAHGVAPAVQQQPAVVIESEAAPPPSGDEQANSMDPNALMMSRQQMVEHYTVGLVGPAEAQGAEALADLDGVSSQGRMTNAAISAFISDHPSLNGQHAETSGALTSSAMSSGAPVEAQSAVRPNGLRAEGTSGIAAGHTEGHTGGHHAETHHGGGGHPGTGGHHAEMHHGGSGHPETGGHHAVMHHGGSGHPETGGHHAEVHHGGGGHPETGGHHAEVHHGGGGHPETGGHHAEVHHGGEPHTEPGATSQMPAPPMASREMMAILASTGMSTNLAMPQQSFSRHRPLATREGQVTTAQEEFQIGDPEDILDGTADWQGLDNITQN